MTHRRTQRLLGNYLDGDLDLDQRARVDGHLDECGHCARDVRELKQTVAMLRGLPTDGTPPDVADAVMARIAAGEGSPPSWLGAYRQFSESGGGGWALAAGLATLLIVVTLEPIPIGAPQGSAPPAESRVAGAPGRAPILASGSGGSLERARPVGVEVRRATSHPAPPGLGSGVGTTEFAGTDSSLEAGLSPVEKFDEEMERLLKRQDSESLVLIMSNNLRGKPARLRRAGAKGDRRLRNVDLAPARAPFGSSQGSAGDVR